MVFSACVSWIQAKRIPVLLRQVLKKQVLGFTLIEMMIAVSVVAITASVLFRSNTSVLQRQGNLEQYTIAHWILIDQIAQRRIERLTSDAAPRLNSHVVRVVQGGNEFEVQVTVSPTRDRDIQRVDYEIYLRGPGGLIGPMDATTTYFAVR